MGRLALGATSGPLTRLPLGEGRGQLVLGKLGCWAPRENAGGGRDQGPGTRHLEDGGRRQVPEMLGVPQQQGRDQGKEKRVKIPKERGWHSWNLRSSLSLEKTFSLGRASPGRPAAWQSASFQGRGESSGAPGFSRPRPCVAGQGHPAWRTVWQLGARGADRVNGPEHGPFGCRRPICHGGGGRHRSSVPGEVLRPRQPGPPCR